MTRGVLHVHIGNYMTDITYNPTYLDANSVSTVASTLAKTTGGSFSFSRLAAFSYSGASALQWPHLKTFTTDKPTINTYCNDT